MTRILAVDDQPANLRLVREVLAPHGMEVVEARSGAEALVVAKESVPDLILLDMHLPDMHGLEVLRRLRESTWGAGLRVVAMSALASADDEKLWRQAGCVGTIEKPITVKTFVQNVSRWLEGAQADAAQAGGEARKRDKLGELLVSYGLITPAQLDAALAAQATTGQRLAHILVDQGAATEDDIAWALSHNLGYPYVFLRPDIVDEETVRLLPESFLRERSVLPILKFGSELTLVMADPTDQRTVDEVVSRTGLQVKRALAPVSKIEAVLEGVGAQDGGRGRPTSTEVRSLQFHVVQALQQGVSEIHFEPAGDGQARVRYRLDGVLVDRPGQPADLHAALLNHLRILVGMGEAPLGTGAAPVSIGDLNLCLAATFLPTLAGPMATVTFYPRRTDAPDLAALGIDEDGIGRLRPVLRAGRGVVLVGCGEGWLRSTLLHALIPSLPGGTIWALETLPIYQRPTLTQTLVRTPAEVAAHLEEAVKADVDLIVVDDLSRPGAVRAAHAAGRTRLVLAGHPEDDAGGLAGQIAEAAGPALTASVLRGILTARSVRLLCSNCRQEAPRKSTGSKERRRYGPQGCEACGFTGYRGRRVLTNVWIPDPNDRTRLRAGDVAGVLTRVAETGDADLRQQGGALVDAGLTSPDELARVVE